MTTITVALDRDRRRDIKLYEGMGDTLTVVVYAQDGDATPLTVISPSFSTNFSDFSLPIGSAYTVPSTYPGRQWYTIRGTINGVLSLLAYGVIEVFGPDWYPSGDDYGWGPRWGYGWVSP